MDKELSNASRIVLVLIPQGAGRLCYNNDLKRRFSAVIEPLPDTRIYRPGGGLKELTQALELERARDKGLRKNKRYTNEEKEAIVRLVYTFIKNWMEPHAIIDYLMKQFNLNKATAWRYLGMGREYAAMRFAGSKHLLRGEVGAFYASILGDVNASSQDRMAAADRICKLFGLFAPDKVINANFNTDVTSDSDRIDMLHDMRQAILNNPEALEAAHRLYESLGLKAPLPLPNGKPVTTNGENKS